MGVHKNRHGVHYVRKKVPKRLEQAVAQVLQNGKERQTFLQQTLSTKDKKEAKVRAAPVLIKFDRLLAEAEASLTDRPIRESLSQAEITRMAEYHFAALLADDEEFRREGGSEALFQSVAQQLADAGVKFKSPFKVGPVPDYGLSDRDMYKLEEVLQTDIAISEHALARADISHMRDNLDELCHIFRIRLDHQGAAYKQLGLAVLREHVKANRAIASRHKGEPIETPKLPETNSDAPSGGDTLSAAFTGWQKARRPAPGTVAEYKRAVALFTELHGDLPVASIKKGHARLFREALQEIPRTRAGELHRAPLPELAEWGREHPEAPRLSEPTINKLMGGIQAISVWARDHGIIPDDVAWSDPFARMRLQEDNSEREPFTIAELQLLFGTPVFTRGECPRGGKGEAAYWLPLLGLFTGARRGELAGLTVANVAPEETTGHMALTFTADRERGKTLKTKHSERFVPLHPELTRLGFTKYVDAIRHKDGEDAWLFPRVSPESKDGAKAWSKWFGRYLRTIGITDRRKVFHSLRHNVKDALRIGGASEELNDALLGHSNGGSVSRGYGSKEMIRRFGMAGLISAISSIKYPGLILPPLHNKP